jgi:hypothetical protein
MKFDRTRDIIDHAVSFHRLLENYFRELSKKTDDQRLKMFLDYLVDHEMSSARYLVEYSESAPHNILDTWFQFSTCEDKFGELKNALKLDKPEEDRILETLISIYDCFIDQFRSFAVLADLDSVRDVFENIAAHEEKEKRKIIRNSRMMNDM